MRKNEPLNLLFVCSRNQWRSPTAEALWRKKVGFNARSAGTSPKAKRTLSAADIRWADIIFVMEQKHKNRMRAQFARLLEHKTIHVLDIADEYQFMDPALVEIIEQSVGGLLPAPLD
jgi:predicted protein tyrosine phosphatase